MLRRREIMPDLPLWPVHRLAVGLADVRVVYLPVGTVARYVVSSSISTSKDSDLACIFHSERTMHDLQGHCDERRLHFVPVRPVDRQQLVIPDVWDLRLPVGPVPMCVVLASACSSRKADLLRPCRSQGTMHHMSRYSQQRRLHSLLVDAVLQQCVGSLVISIFVLNLPARTAWSNSCVDCGWGCYSSGTTCICPSSKPWLKARSAVDSKRQLCPTGFTACPIAGSPSGLAVQQPGVGAFECLDVQEELTSVCLHLISGALSIMLTPRPFAVRWLRL